MARIFIPTRGPADWQRLLAKPDLHWRTGYSARAIAHAWEASGNLPPEIAALLTTHPALAGTEPDLLVAFPEWKVPLPGGTTESQNDVFALVRVATTTLALAIEGKVAEPFGPTVAEWRHGASAGKAERLNFLCGLLGLNEAEVESLRYQLLHRAASAVIEQRRFGTSAAVMIVHSFSADDLWHDDFAAFTRCFGATGEIGRLEAAHLPDGAALYLGWAKGDPAFLAA